MTNTVYMAWRDAAKRWYPVGELSFADAVYRFRYLRGAAVASKEAGFEPLVAFPRLDSTYTSPRLFPTFENRIPAPTHRDYEAYVEWMALPLDRAEPIDLLGRSGGERATDLFQLFPKPERTTDGRILVHVFAHGLRHLPAESKERALRLADGDELDLVPEPDNPVDPYALRKHTGDGMHVGYVPRYLAEDLPEPTGLSVSVVRVNRPPVPIQFRLLCRIEGPWNEARDPCSGEMFQPIALSAAVSR